MKRFFFFILAGLLFTASSCKKWLDVDPRSVVKEEEMFEDAQGFRTALFGVYTKMASTDLYGANLSFGFLDVLAQYYGIESSQHSFYDYATYNYSQRRTLPDAVWRNGYNLIANCNNILGHIDGKKDVFSLGEYSLIKAEATAIRAFVHLDLLRLFAPSFAVNSAAPAIPYVNRVSHQPFPQLTVKEVLEAVIADLETAAAMLKHTDPWSADYDGSAGAGTELPVQLTLRQERMNYYAVLGTLARAHLYMNSPAKAYDYASQVLAGRPSGSIFTLFSGKSWDNSDLYFNSEISANSKLVVPEGRKYEFYETSRYGSIDSRYKNWFRYYPGSNEEFVAKYMRSVPQNGNPPNLLVMRTEEMYYIKAETAPTEEEAVQLLNTVRASYGLGSAHALVAGSVDLQEEIMKEYRKTFIGEGQFFFYLKRKNVSPIPYSTIDDVQKAYVLPIPDLEIEFGNIK